MWRRRRRPSEVLVHRGGLGIRIERIGIGVRLGKAWTIRLWIGRRIRIGHSIRRAARKTAQPQTKGIGIEMWRDHTLWDGAALVPVLLADSAIRSQRMAASASIR
jgi:hypothetical protein